ncbi:MAG: cell division protein FtsZ [Candidatus Baldrarchaeia archaeon]
MDHIAEGLLDTNERRDVESRSWYSDEELEKILRSMRSRILVAGVGGAGNNTVTRLKELGIDGVETLAINTDVQDLLSAKADRKLLIGKEITGGLGAGNDPSIGEAAALEDFDRIKELVSADLVFITCGLGGGTGTGASPIVARAAKDQGALTVAVCTLPFKVEGKKRLLNAMSGLKKLVKICDTVIAIPNDRLLSINPDLTISQAFLLADEILISAVKGITELVTKPGLVNVDFADVRTILEDAGLSLISVGESEGENRSTEAVEKVIYNPLLDVDISGARGALINITGGPDLTLKDVQIIIERISSMIDPEAEIKWGAIIEPSLERFVRITLIASGIDSSYMVKLLEHLNAHEVELPGGF